MYYVADTHALIWHLAGSKTLSVNAQRIFELADAGKAVIILPAIVLLECMDMIDKKKVRLELRDVLQKIMRSPNFQMAEMNWPLLLATEDVKGFKDLHDRIIVATAALFDASLISKDKKITERYPKTIW